MSLTVEEARGICADSNGFEDCDMCPSSQEDCDVSLSYVRKVMKKQYYCDDGDSYYYGFMINNPLKHHEDCGLSHSCIITCMNCAHRKELISGNKLCKTIECPHHKTCRQYEAHGCNAIMDAITLVTQGIVNFPISSIHPDRR